MDTSNKGVLYYYKRSSKIERNDNAVITFKINRSQRLRYNYMVDKDGIRNEKIENFKYRFAHR